MNANKEKLNHMINIIKPGKCQLCGNDEWEITEKVFQLYEFDNKGLLLKGAAYPVIPITCKNCGNTILVNAIKAGVIDKDADN